MKIIIVGGGKVGHQIGKKLTNEKHDVVIIDDDPDVLARISDEMDVFCVEGNGADYKVQSEAGAGSADILIAATAHDEINMLCCLIAHKLGAKHTIARVRDPEYTVQLDFLKDELGLSMAINPELAAADEIARLLRIPSALNVELYRMPDHHVCQFFGIRVAGHHVADVLPLAQHRHAVGQRLHLVHLVGDNDNRLAGVAHVAQDGEELVRLLRGQHSGRLIQNQRT